MTPRNRQKGPAVQADQAKAQKTAAGSPVERPRRTSKHRTPQQPGQPPQRRPKSEPVRRLRQAQSELQSRERGSSDPWLKPDRFSRRVAGTGVAFIIALIIVTFLGAAYYLISDSRFFALRAVDVQGNVLLSQEEVEGIVRPLAKRGVLKADLLKIREELKNHGLVKEAEVTRLLPDMLQVTIKERDPYAPARRSDGSVVCVDREGMMFGDQSYLRSKPILPLISGLAENGERAAEINRQRMLTYQKLLAELDATQPQLSSRIDEVHFDEVQGVRVILADSRIAVFLGKEDFRVRLNAALDVLDAVRRKSAEDLNVLRISDVEKLLSGAKITYINAMIPKRVVVGLEE